MIHPTVAISDGLSPAIDAVAAIAPASHAFLRAGWYGAAVAAYGGPARTLVAAVDGVPALAVPIVARRWGLVEVAGSYWPFRAPVAVEGAAPAVFAAAVATLARTVRALRIGPVPDDDPVVTPLVAAARDAGWVVLDRVVGTGWLLDLTQPDWPRGSTLRKNRFHEKHLGEHGVLDWRLLGPGDWPAAFDDLAAVEAVSWHGDKADAKFAGSRHAGFWRAAAADPAVAGMLRGALLTIAGRPAAFSFDIETGTRTHAIANSYDPAFSKHSPGKLLQYRNLVAARDRGVALVDWGSGDSGYKRTLGAVEGAHLRDWLLCPPGLPALAARVFGGRWT